MQNHVHGNSATASKLSSARNFALTGAVIGSSNFDGSGNVSIATSLTNQVSNLNLSQSGKVIFKRKGNTVFVIAESTCPKDGAFTIGGNTAKIPDWALPSNDILTSSSLKTNTVTDMNGLCRGYLILNRSTKNISVVMYNIDENNAVTLTMNVQYIVD